MIRKLLGVSKIQSLQAQSTNALSQFNTVIASLEDINLQLDEEFDSRTEIIDKAKTGQEIIANQQKNNRNIVDKIKYLVS